MFTLRVTSCFGFRVRTMGLFCTRNGATEFARVHRFRRFTAVFLDA